MIYHPDDFMEILRSAKGKWGDRLRAMIISRSQAIRIGLMMDEDMSEGRIIFMPGEQPRLAESYAHMAKCKHQVRCDSITIRDVAPFSKLMGVQMFFREEEIPPQIMVRGEGVITWFDEVDTRWERVDG